MIGGRTLTLNEAIIRVLGQEALTYREITDTINEQRLYVPRDGMLVPRAQVRAVIRESSRFFDIDRSRSAHKVRVHR